MNVFAETDASHSTPVYLRLCSNPMLQRLVSMESVTIGAPALDSAAVEVMLALCRRRHRLHSRLANFIRPRLG